MTPRELAEKICTLLNVNPIPKPFEKAQIANIEAVEAELSSALEEAVDEAKLKWIDADMGDLLNVEQARAEGIKEGQSSMMNNGPAHWLIVAKQEAYEQCAKIAEKHDETDFDRQDAAPGKCIADMIRCKSRQAAKEIK